MASGSEKRIRGRTITVRFTEAEHVRLASAADRAALSLADYVRSMSLGQRPLRAVRRHPTDQAVLSKLLSELGKIGSNINQIAHVGNQTGRIREGLLEHALAELMDVKQGLIAALRVPTR